MIKKMIILIVMGLTLSSCQEIAIRKYSIDDAKQQAEIRKITSPYYEKEGGWAYQANKEVLDIVKEVLKRPINKEIQFDGIKIMIPENTRLNLKTEAIVDIKTGYGLPVCIYIRDYCDTYSDARSKKRLAGAITIFVIFQKIKILNYYLKK